MNKVQGIGIVERLVYSAFLFIAMKFVSWGYLNVDDAAYMATGGLAAVGSIRAFVINRPSKLMSDAADQLPQNSKLVITSTAGATGGEKSDIHALADASSTKVTAKTTG